jgi:dipeptidyl aminopeptidase/acylaminoacyl peptidase
VQQPEGGAVAFSGGIGDVNQIERIAVYEPSAGGMTYLTSDEVRSLQPAWSPDGSRIAYTSGPSPAGLIGERIWVMNSDGSGSRQLTNDKRYRDESPQWSTDGRRILFARMQFEQPSIPIVSLWWLDPASLDVSPLVVRLDAPTLRNPRYAGFFGPTQGHLQWDLVFDWWQETH